MLRDIICERIERERRLEAKLTDLKAALGEAEASEVEPWEGAEAIIKAAYERRADAARTKNSTLQSQNWRQMRFSNNVLLYIRFGGRAASIITLLIGLIAWLLR